MMSMKNTPSIDDKIKITCGANGCFNEAELECPFCKLNVCYKHKVHNIKYEKESIKAHSVEK